MFQLSSFFEDILNSSQPLPKDSSQSINKEEVSFDCFIAHEWGTAADGFKSHETAKMLKKKLKEYGLKVWLDEDNLGDNVALGISNGLSQSAVTIVLLTKRYFDRCDDRDTNAHKEFVMASTFGQEFMLPLVLEKDYLDTKKWPNGVVKYHLGEILWKAFVTDKDKKNQIGDIAKQVKKLSLKKQGKKKEPVRDLEKEKAEEKQKNAEEA